MSYNIKNIRALLTEGFSEDELRQFCHDEPAFRPVESELSNGTGLAGVVQHLLAYSERKVLVELLLDWAKKQSPAKYKQYLPYRDSDLEPSSQPEPPVQPKESIRPHSRELFVSYAWGGESEEIVDKVDRAFEVKGITIIRDKRDAGYKASIKEFMERIGRGKAVIVVISQKYLKSPNCMFELLQIAENGQFRDRIFPIVLDDAQIYDPIDRIKYIKYWEEKIRELDEAVKGVSPRYISDIIEDVNLYDDIRRGLPKLTTVLKDMNTLTAKLHSESGFEELLNAVEQKLAE